jgi:L-xylulose reductase
VLRGRWSARVVGAGTSIGGRSGREDIGGPFLEQMPLGRWATEDEIAAPIVFLLSDGASMISGVSLPIDGGYTSR